MAENIINIKIRLTGVEAFGKSLKGVSANLAQFGKEISRVGTTIAWTGAAITGPLVLAFKNAEKYSTPVRQELERLKNASIGFQTSIATALLPTARQLTNFFGRLLAIWNSLNPVIQQSIAQAVAWTGIWLMVGGTIGVVTGKIITLVGNIGRLLGGLIAFAGANAPLVAIVAIVAALVAIFWKLKGATETLNGIEVAFYTLGIGASKALSGIVFVMDKVMFGFQKLYEILGKAPLVGKFYRGIASGIESARGALTSFDARNKEVLAELESRITKIMSGQKGTLAKGFEDIIGLVKELSKTTKIEIPVMVQEFNHFEEASKQVAASMTKNFGDLFFNVFTGEVKNAQQVFADFGRSIMNIITQALARFMLFATVGKALTPFFGFNIFGSFHNGGVVRAHSGMLAKDEVPIIAQTGERVLSRSQNRQYEKMMAGGGVGGNSITNQPVLVIQAWDTSDILKNRKAIEGIISNALRTNSELRGDVRRYG